MKIFHKKVPLTIIILISILSLIYSFLLFNVFLKGGSYNLNKSDVIIILGYSDDNEKTEQDYLEERLKTALELYNNGYAKNIIVCSSVNTNEVIPISVSMKKWLIEKGIPSDLVFIENYSTDIYESLAYSKEICLENDWNSAIIVSNDFDNYKSVSIAKEFFEEVSSKEAIVKGGGTKFRLYLKEPFSFLKYKVSFRNYDKVIKSKENSPYNLEKNVNTIEKYNQVINRDDITFYEIVINYDDEKDEFLVEQKVSFKNTSNTELEKIKLNLFHNRLKEEYSKTTNYIDIKEIWSNDINLPFDNYSSYLDINIPKLEPNASLTFQINFTATIPKGNYITGANDNVIWAKDFFPTIAEFKDGEFIYNDYFTENGYNEISKYKITFITDKDYEVVLPDISLVQVNGNEKRTIMETTLIRDVSFAILKNNKKTSTNTKNNVKITLYHEEVNSLTYNLLNTVLQAVNYMELNIGTYPYNNLSIVEVSLDRPLIVSSGCIIFVDKDYLSNPNVKLELINKTVNQWFSHMLGTDPSTSTYLTIGISRMIGSSIYNNSIDDDYYKTQFMMLQSIYYSLKRTKINDNFYNDSDYTSYYNIKYLKSELMQYSLQKIIGDSWQDFLRAYFKIYAFAIADEQDFQILAKEFTNENLDNFFKNWLSEDLIDTQGGND